MRTELRSLEMLVAVADHGSIGAAGRALGLRQPSATDRLNRLERRLGVPLLQRSSRGTTLTPLGVTVADWAREVLAASDRLEAGVDALQQTGERRLQVSASMTIAEYLMPRWLAALRARSPDTNVALRVCNSEQVARDVLAGAADIGFVEDLGRVTGLHHRQVGSDRLVLIVPPGHEWSRRRRPVTPAELVAARLVLREAGSGTRQALELALARVSMSLHPTMELGSTAAVKAAVVSGQGVAVLSELAAADDVAAGRLLTVPVDLVLRRRLRVVWRAGTSLTGPSVRLAAIAEAAPGRT
jgi:DNA-binding transcriptional LysR family regulator